MLSLNLTQFQGKDLWFFLKCNSPRVISHKLSTQKPDGKKSKNYADSYRKINPNLAKPVKACTLQRVLRHSLNKLLFFVLFVFSCSISYSRSWILGTNTEENSALILWLLQHSFIYTANIHPAGTWQVSMAHYGIRQLPHIYSSMLCT